MAHGRRSWAVGVASGLVLLSLAVPAASSGSTVRFRQPVVVDPALGFSEGFVLEDPRTKRLVLASHAGNSLLYRPGVAGSPSGDVGFVSGFRNQVNLWTSRDGGRTWQRSDVAGSGFFTSPASNTGDSDPMLTSDAAGTIYGVGNNLANDSLFASTDGGKTWPVGSLECHEGDRPWIAGGAPHEVFLSTSSFVAAVKAHGTRSWVVVQSRDGGASCSRTEAQAEGDLPDGTWTGGGPLLYDRRTGALVAPAEFDHAKGLGLGVAVLPDAHRAFSAGASPQFTLHEGVRGTSTNMFWKPVGAFDGSGTLYLAWTTQAPAGRANSLMVVSSPDLGRTWTRPRVLVHTGRTLMMPWLVAGARGSVNVSWFSYDRVTDPESAPAGATARIFTQSFTKLGAAAERASAVIDVFGRPVHTGAMCTSGTSCVATGEDRRFGELFTTALDSRGCLLVTAPDTTATDDAGNPLPLGRGLFTRQVGGPSLTSGTC